MRIFAMLLVGSAGVAALLWFTEDAWMPSAIIGGLAVTLPLFLLGVSWIARRTIRSVHEAQGEAGAHFGRDNTATLRTRRVAVYAVDVNRERRGETLNTLREASFARTEGRSTGIRRIPRGTKSAIARALGDVVHLTARSCEDDEELRTLLDRIEQALDPFQDHPPEAV